MFSATACKKELAIGYTIVLPFILLVSVLDCNTFGICWSLVTCEHDGQKNCKGVLEQIRGVICTFKSAMLESMLAALQGTRACLLA